MERDLMIMEIIYELINGNGTIKDYVNDILMFEGEYKNGKKWKGKEYNSKGKLLFKGKYSNGEKQKGKEYDSEGTLIFKDEYWMEKNGMEK